MKVHVITDVTVCFEAEIPEELIATEGLPRLAWKEWDKLTENLSLPFEMNNEGSEIYSIVNADTGKILYRE